MNGRRIRALIVDDSAVVRGLLAKALETEPSIEVAGTAMHGEAAVRFMQRHPVDVAILDVEMPVMDGLTALRRIQQEFPDVAVIMVSSLTSQGAETTVRALALGAAGCIAKPVARSMSESIDKLAEELAPLVLALGRARQESVTPPADHAPAPRRRGTQPRPQIVVIGASTGGPNALNVVLTGLPADFPLPILIVQHMPGMFTPLLARHIARDTGRPCAEAVEQGPVLRGTTYVAPGGYHLTLDKVGDRMVTRLNQAPPEHFCRPSINPLFRTAAEWYGHAVLGIMLTGMGEDGLEGTRAIVERHGYMIAQDQATSVVWGMPGAVVRENLAHEILPLAEIPRAITRLCLLEACSA